VSVPLSISERAAVEAAARGASRIVWKDEWEDATGEPFGPAWILHPDNEPFRLHGEETWISFTQTLALGEALGLEVVES
jgi:hypothetical protein